MLKKWAVIKSKLTVWLIMVIVICSCNLNCTYGEENTDSTNNQSVEENTDSAENQPANENNNANEADNGINLQAESAILMEASTGKVIFEKEADKQLPPASITKIMTLLLIFDSIEQEKIKLDDIVTTSEYAASMGGSQVFLEPMEQQSVDTMIKCIAVASANDACVAYRYSRQRKNPCNMYIL